MSQKMIEGVERYIADACLSKSAAAAIRQVVGDIGIEKLAGLGDAVSSIGAAYNQANAGLQDRVGVTGANALIGGGAGALGGAGLGALFGSGSLKKRLLSGAIDGAGLGALAGAGSTMIGQRNRSADIYNRAIREGDPIIRSRSGRTLAQMPSEVSRLGW